MSKRSAQVIAIAGAAALAGLGYAYAHRSGARPARLRSTRASTHSLPGAQRSDPLAALATPRATERLAAPPAPFQEAERISSSPDALDVALDLDGVFEGEASGIELTARPHEHVPAPRTPDDEDAPAPEDLGRAWLTQATESERSLGTADTLPDLERLPSASDELGEASEEDQDETTAEYVRRHRISSQG
ncbi:MAG TPA: hypothetical protein VFK05_02860 [Polyangiaceae bacterium]|nr:hypothetical protein [Polyangiaceae bacterium]